jgi:hypothetical protein
MTVEADVLFHAEVQDPEAGDERQAADRDRNRD